MKKSLITLLLLCTAALVQAATLKGVVKDSSTGEPLTGATVYVKGTASAPIVMTSSKEEPGAWGGIHICGRAHTNAEGGKGSSEIGGAVYGGDNDADNSGVLKYVRVEYSGYAFDEEHEAILWCR